MRVRTVVCRQGNFSHSDNWPRRGNLLNSGREIEPVVNNQGGSSQHLTITRLQLVGMRINPGWNQTGHARRITDESRGEITQRPVNGDDIDLGSVGRTLGQPQDEQRRQCARLAPCQNPHHRQ